MIALAWGAIICLAVMTAMNIQTRNRLEDRIVALEEKLEEPESLEDSLHRRKQELVALKRASGLVKYDYSLVDLERELKRDLDAIDKIWEKE